MMRYDGISVHLGHGRVPAAETEDRKDAEDQRQLPKNDAR